MNIYSIRMLKWPSKEIETFEFKGESLADIEDDVVKMYNQHPLWTQVSWNVREALKGE